MSVSVPVKKLIVLGLCTLMAFSMIFLAAYSVYVVQEDKRFGGDFIAFWLRAEEAAHGRSEEIYDPALLKAVIASPGDFPPAEPIAFFPYPPSALLILTPFGMVPYGLAVLAWIAAGWGFYLFAASRSPLWHVLKDVAGRKDAKIIAGFIALSPFVFVNVMTAHAGFLLAGLFMLGLALLDTKPKLAGVCFGLLLFKPQLALLLPIALAAGGYWSVMRWTAIVIATQIAAVSLIWGGSLWTDYFHYMTLFPQALESVPHVLKGLKISAYRSLVDIGAGGIFASIVQGIFALIAAATVWLVWRRPQPPGLRAAILSSAIFLALPHLMIYDMTLCTLPALWLMHRLWSGKSDAVERAALMLLLIIPMVGMIANTHGVPLVFPVLLLLHFVLCRGLIRRPS